MLTALVQGVKPNVKNVWSFWINHLTKDREQTGIRDAALVTKHGSVSSHTPQFKLSVQDIQSLNDLFRKGDVNRISLQGRTYMINAIDEKHMIAFNDKNCLIVCPSKTMYIVVRTECLQERLVETVTWIEHMCAKLSSCNYWTRVQDLTVPLLGQSLNSNSCKEVDFRNCGNFFNFINNN